MYTDKKIYDGDYEVLFSGVFNIYENKLEIKQINGYDFIFEFKDEDPPKEDVRLVTIGDDDNKIITIRLYKFRNILGTGTLHKIPILKAGTNEQVFFSILAYSLNDKSPLLNVSINFYLK